MSPAASSIGAVARRAKSLGNIMVGYSEIGLESRNVRVATPRPGQARDAPDKAQRRGDTESAMPCLAIDQSSAGNL
jgi:hypothetical protein